MILATVKAMKCMCALETFTINGEKADSDDFGFSYDECPENADDYGCGNKIFMPYELGSKEFKACKAKYKISTREYMEIVAKLKEELDFGHCSLCS